MKYLILLTIFTLPFCSSPSPTSERSNAADTEKSLIDTLKEKAESEDGQKMIQTMKEKAQDKEMQEKVKSFFKKDEKK